MTVRAVRLVLLASLAILASLDLLPARADYIFNVSLDTSGLMNNANRPFGLDFQLVQGDGSVSNTATISQIDLGTGRSVSSLATINSSGDLTSTIKLDDRQFFSDFNQQFTPGSSLSFQVDITTNIGTTAPDQFTFAIFQDYTTNPQEIPTTSPSGSLLSVNLDSNSPTVQQDTFSVGNQQFTPEVQPAAAMPEPSTLTLLALGLGTLAIGRRWQPRRRAIQSKRPA